MQSGGQTSNFFKILLALVVLLVLSVQPASRQVTSALERARTARQAGQHAQAAQALREALEREPWRIGLWEQIAQEEYAAGRIPEAASALESALREDALTPEGWQMLAEVYDLLGQTEAAYQAWRDVLQVNGYSARAYERIAQIQRSRGDLELSVQTLREWQSRDGQNARAAYLLGLHLSVIAPDEALAPLLQASQLDSRYTPPVQTLRTGLSQAANSDDAGYGWLMIGRALGSLAQWDLAERAFEEATRIAPQYAEAWAFLGEARYHLGGGGRPELDRARQLAPDSITVRALTALYWRRQGDPERAITDLEAIEQQEPDQPVWKVELGNAWVEMGDLQVARSYYEQAVALAPNDTQYWQRLATFSAQFNEDVRDMGLPAARQAVVLAPEDPGALDVMGLTLMTLGDLASAERFLQRSLEKDAENALVHLHLGQLYLQLGETWRARPYLRRAASLAGETSTGEIARRLLSQYFKEGG